MNDNITFSCSTLLDTQQAGESIAGRLSFPSCVYLQGGLGAGKTTLCQSIIRAFGYQGSVTSPTYNLVQEYAVEQGMIYHMDLYRMEDPSELEFLALDDLWTQSSIFLIEWPEKGETWLRKPTHQIDITQSGTFREIMLNCDS